MKLTDEQRKKAAQAAVDVPAYGRWWSDIADAVAATLPDAPTNPAPTLERGPDTPSPITWGDMREGDRVRIEWEATLVDGHLDRDPDPTYYLLSRKPDPRPVAARELLAHFGVSATDEQIRALPFFRSES